MPKFLALVLVWLDPAFSPACGFNPYSSGAVWSVAKRNPYVVPELMCAQDELTATLSVLPFVSRLEGIGGHIKSQPSHFRVVELANERMDRVPIDKANVSLRNARHAYVTLTREGMNTRDVASVLARAFSARLDDIGYAGLKDRHALCTQTFSLPRDLLSLEFRSSDALAAIVARCDAEGFAVRGQPRWHKSKLRKGQLCANRFEIILSDTDLAPAEALIQARMIADSLRHTGWANFYGLQRFGTAGPEGTLAKSRELLASWIGRRGKRRFSPWLVKFKLAAFQSVLFNEYLAKRMRIGKFGELWAGDLVCPLNSTTTKVARMVKATLEVGHAEACNHATNANTSSDLQKKSADAIVPKDDADAFAANEISFTGPLYGAQMHNTSGCAWELEDSVWQQHMPGIPLSAIKKDMLVGGRRTGRLPLPPDLEICECPEANGLMFRFTLPAGSYATSLLREFIGRECKRAGELMEEQFDVVTKASDVRDKSSLGMALWAKAEIAGLRITYVSPREEKEAISQSIDMFKTFLAEDISTAALTEVNFTIVRDLGSCQTLLLLQSSVAMEPFTPVAFAMRALEQALSTGVSPAPLVVGLLPMQSCCPADIDSILESLKRILHPLGSADDGEHLYRVVIKQRGSVRMDAGTLVAEIAGLVQRISPHAKVDLEQAYMAITVDVFDGTACLAVLTGWHRFHGYNLPKAAAGKPVFASRDPSGNH